MSEQEKAVELIEDRYPQARLREDANGEINVRFMGDSDQPTNHDIGFFTVMLGYGYVVSSFSLNGSHLDLYFDPIETDVSIGMINQ